MAADDKFIVTGDFSGFVREADKANKAFEKLTANVKKYSAEAKSALASVRGEAFKIPPIPKIGPGGGGGSGLPGSGAGLNVASLQRTLSQLGNNFSNLGGTTRALSREMNRAIRELNSIRGGVPGGGGGGVPGVAPRPGGGGGGAKKGGGGFSMTGHWASDLAMSVMPGRSVFPSMAIHSGLRGAGVGMAGATAGAIAGGLGVAGGLALGGAVVGSGLEDFGIQNTLSKYRNYNTSVPQLRGMANAAGMDPLDFARRQVQLQNAEGISSDQAGKYVSWASDMSVSSGGKVSVDQAMEALQKALQSNTESLTELSKVLGVDIGGKNLEDAYGAHKAAGITGAADTRSNFGKAWDRGMARAGDVFGTAFKWWDDKAGSAFNAADKAVDDFYYGKNPNGTTATDARETINQMRKSGQITSQQFRSMMNSAGQAEQSGDMSRLQKFADAAPSNNPFAGRKDQMLMPDDNPGSGPVMPNSGNFKTLRINIPNLPRSVGSVSITDEM